MNRRGGSEMITIDWQGSCWQRLGWKERQFEALWLVLRARKQCHAVEWLHDALINRSINFSWCDTFDFPRVESALPHRQPPEDSASTGSPE